MSSFRYSAIISAVFLLLLATGLKLVPWVPNVALFGALSIFCGAYLRGPIAWIIPLGGIVASDFLGEVLGVPGVYRYTAISMILNYAGFAAMVGVGHLLRERQHLVYGEGQASAEPKPSSAGASLSPSNPWQVVSTLPLALRTKDSWDRVIGTSLLGSVTFFLISNFGCWLDPVMNYSPTLTGLFDCYFAAIPFFRNSFLSDVFGTVGVIAIHQAAMNYQVSEARETV